MPNPKHTQDQNEEGLSIAAGNNARVSWNMGGDQIMNATKHYPASARDALRWFFFYCIDADISRSEAATLVKVDQSIIYRVYTRTYKDKKNRSILPKTLIANIQSFRPIEGQRVTLGDVPFVLTPTAATIWKLCDLAVSSNRIAMIWGKSQTGKTTALLEYKRKHNHGSTKYIRIEPSSGIHEMMRQIGKECALSPRTSYNRLKEQVARAVDRNTLLIVDEIHELAFTYRQRSKLSCVEVLRWLHDSTRCGMVICGTNLWRDELKEGKDKLLLEQMERRGVFKRQLPSEPTRADLKTLFKKAFTLDWPTGVAAEIIKEVNTQQGLTAITEYLRYGHRLAAKAEEPLSWSHFVKAHAIIKDLETPS